MFLCSNKGDTSTFVNSEAAHGELRLGILKNGSLKVSSFIYLCNHFEAWARSIGLTFYKF